METTYTERSDVKSNDAKLMREKGLSWFHNKNWHRRVISSEKFKEIYEWITDKNNIVLTHVSMRSSHQENVFINIDVYNKYIDTDMNFYFVLADKRKKISPKWLNIRELRGIILERKQGVTGGVIIPDDWFHEFPPREVNKC